MLRPGTVHHREGDDRREGSLGGQRCSGCHGPDKEAHRELQRSPRIPGLPLFRRGNWFGLPVSSDGTTLHRIRKETQAGVRDLPCTTGVPLIDVSFIRIQVSTSMVEPYNSILMTHTTLGGCFSKIKNGNIQSTATVPLWSTTRQSTTFAGETSTSPGRHTPT